MYSQVIKTGDNTSSILLGKSNLAYDFKKDEATLTVTNTELVSDTDKHWLWSVSLNAKNKDGFAKILEDGGFTPETKLGGVVAYTFTNYKSKFKEELKILKIKKDALIEAIKNKNDIIYNGLTTKIDNTDLEFCYKVVIKEQIENKESPLGMRTALLKFKESPQGCRILLNLSDTIIDELVNYINEELPEIADLNDINNQIGVINLKLLEYDLNHNTHDFTFYTHGGLLFSKYDFFTGWSNTGFDDSFTKEKFTGTYAGIGFNYSVNGTYRLGLKYTYEESNNISVLETNNFKETTVVEVDGVEYTNISDEKEAYYDEFQKAYLNKLDFDFMAIYPIGKKDKDSDQRGYLIIADLYSRASLSNNDAILPGTVDIGISASLFKNSGKFAGGLYVELPDVAQKKEKLKDDPNLKPFYERFSVGLFTSFNFDSLFQL